MKKLITLLAFIIHINEISPQLLIDTTYCIFDSSSNFYKPKLKIFFSEANNPQSIYFKRTYGEATLRPLDFYTDITGKKHHKYEQVFNNIPIINSHILIREVNDTIISATGLINTHLPELRDFHGAQQVSEHLMSSLNVYKYKWQDSLSEANIKEELNDSSATNYPVSKLSILKLNTRTYDESTNYLYVYVITISAKFSALDYNFIDSTYYLDARNMNIIKRFSASVSCFHNEPKASQSLSSCAQNCNSTSVTLHYYAGQTIYTEQFLYGLLNCTHRLKDNCTGTTLYVKQLGGTFGGEHDFLSNANNWIASGTPSDKVGATTLWSISQTHDFFRIWLNRNSYDNNFGQIKAVVDPVGYGTTSKGTYYTFSSNQINVSKFSTTQSYECTLDIMAHEISHGVTDKICSLMQNGGVGTNDEEGALGEGYGDIFGQGTEYYVNSNLTTTGSLNDFYHGSNFPLIPLKQRDLANPNFTGNPATYLGLNYVTYFDGFTLGIPDFWHTNSTIISHWYYLLSLGGAGQNDNSVNYCVSAIGQYKALQIAYLSLYYLVGTNKQFLDARNATMQAAANLYGNGSNEVAQVTAAWYAVGVGPQYTGPIEIKNVVINTPQTYIYNAKIVLENVTTNPSAGLIVKSNTEIELKNEISFNQSSENELYIAPACNGGARIGSFGSGDDTADNTNLNNNTANGDLVSIFPNPTNGEVVIKIASTGILPKSVAVSNVLGEEIITLKNTMEYEMKFDLNNYSNGIYFINVFYENKTISKKIVKN